MELQYVYQKRRSEFGRQCMFSDKGPELIDDYPSNNNHAGLFIFKDPVSQGVQCTPIQAEHHLNTTRAEYSNVGINHTEGGWPKDVNIHDEEQTKRYRRKIEKDEGYNPGVMALTKSMESCILQNNAINIYQQYFSDVEPTPLVERSSARTVNVYQDQCSNKRPINHISWSPDSGTKLAATYCDLQFQAVVPKEACQIYIWEVENPNRPFLTFKPSTPTVCLEYHQKDSNLLVSGQHNGLVAVWDTRRGAEPVDQSLLEVSHRDPVCKVLWINSKSGTEFFSTSSDGQVKWWDMRKLSEPLDNLILSIPGQIIESAIGATCLEYEPSIPTRFMVGTENGVAISCNRKGKSPAEKMALRFQAHLGPVLALQRNAAFAKNFLTIGDWTAKIFSEECRESPIMWTSYHRPMLTDGGWSPTRYSVFFTTRSDGTLDVWDILQQQKQACLGVKVCDERLKCLRAHEMGRLVAVGNQKGTTYLVQFSENLSTCNKNDKMLLTAMFERESKREKILEARNREMRLKMKTKSAQALTTESGTDMKKEPSVLMLDNPLVLTAEEEFFQVIHDELHGPDLQPEDPVSQGVQCTPVQAEHYINTTRAEYSNTGINHTEGGWPKDVNIHDEEQTKRYRRKIEKEDAYNPVVMGLTKSMESCILQNNAINIYQQYFSDVEPTPLVERSSARTVNVYQDQCLNKRPINHISWSPDDGTKLAVTYCDLQFQAVVPKEACQTYIWEVENPNRPLLTFKPSTPTVCLEYHQKDCNSLVSGQHSGLVAVWDTRRGAEPVDQSLLEVSHRDPVCNVLWINSKSGTEFFSTSSDGQVKWWDTRKLNEPLETLILSAPGQIIERAMGATCLEYESSIPTRFMVGTENGVAISCNRKGKSPSEKMALRFQAHLGPVLALQRNAAFAKNFLSIGDWTAKIFSEECRESPIMWTSYHRPMLTDGGWSPTRYSVFFTTRSDGTLDVWDILQQQKQACLGVKVCDERLKCLRAHEMGRLVAVGNQKGTTYLVQFSENLSTCNKNDKMLLTAMFERESRREKILEARNRELRLKMKTKSAQALTTESGTEIKEKEPSVQMLGDPLILQAEEEFFQVIHFELYGPDPEPEEEEMQEFEEPEPEPPPPPPPPEKKGKDKKEGKEKKKK